MDDLVASAIAHWGPRFTTNGVTVSDFQRVTARVDRWADWCAAWSDMGAEHEALHAWLEPILKNIRDLKSTSTTEQGNEIAKSLSGQVKAFTEFFN